MIPTHDEVLYHVLNMTRGVIVAKNVELLKASLLTGLKQWEIRARLDPNFVHNTVSSRFPIIYKLPYCVVRAGMDGSVVQTVDDIIRSIEWKENFDKRRHDREVAAFRRRVAAQRRLG